MNKTLFPDAVQLGSHYHFWGDLKLNAWAIVSVVTAMVSRSALHGQHDWTALMQAAIALSPLVPSLLYVRSLAKWIRGMDELQRRIQLEACLFAMTATVFLATALSLLESSGLLLSARLRHGLGWEGTFAAVVVFYILGNAIFNRRYR
jgi:hypothetical protein